MDLLRPDQIITLAAFLAALCALWVYVQRNRDGLNARMGRGRRLKLVETAALGPADRAMILSVDDREFLILRMKGAAPVVQALPAAAPAPEGVA
jgi:flagellar protein FliO/FliZ